MWISEEEKKYAKKIHAVYSACCSGIFWDQPKMKMIDVFQKPTKQKCPKVLT